MYDTVVVGAGPVGSYVAGQLSALGFAVAVVESHERAGESVCCTGILGKECLNTFPIDHGLVLNASNSAKIFAPFGKYLRVSKEEVQAYIIDRVAYEVTLAQKAQDSGAEYYWGHRVKDITYQTNSVQVRIEDKSIVIEGQTVVIACGFHSHLPQKLGLGRIRYFAAGAQAEVEVNAIDEVEVYLGRKIAPDFFAWLVPTFPGKALAGLMANKTPGVYLRELLTRLHKEGKILSPTAHINYGGIPLKPLRRTYAERTLVVGDAAGQVKPTTGGGVYYGLLCGQKAVETLRQTLTSGDFSAQNLATYEKEWKRLLGGELRTGYWGRKVYEHLSDARVDRIINTIESRNIHETLLNDPDFSYDWHKGLIRSGAKQLGVRGIIQLLRP